MYSELIKELVMKNTPEIPDELHGNAAIEFAKSHLIEIRTDPSLWTIEYENPTSGEKWVMDYPQGELQGGGPPRLRRIDSSQQS